jgi:hypothetical protein
MASLLDRFHQHLDRCAQCRNNPHDLCAVGALILTASASAGMIAAEHRLQRTLCQRPEDHDWEIVTADLAVCWLCGERR